MSNNPSGDLERVSVPVVPTEAMLDEACYFWGPWLDEAKTERAGRRSDDPADRERARQVWAQMIAAAPPPARVTRADGPIPDYAQAYIRPTVEAPEGVVRDSRDANAILELREQVDLGGPHCNVVAIQKWAADRLLALLEPRQARQQGGE